VTSLASLVADIAARPTGERRRASRYAGREDG
jgi:hypothetical protein